MTSDASVFLSVGWPLWFTDRNMSQQLSDGSPQHFVRIWWRPDDFVDAVTFSSGNTMRFSFILWKRGTPLMSESVYRSPVVYMLMCEAFFFLPPDADLHKVWWNASSQVTSVSVLTWPPRLCLRLSTWTLLECDCFSLKPTQRHWCMLHFLGRIQLLKHSTARLLTKTKVSGLATWLLLLVYKTLTGLDLTYLSLLLLTYEPCWAFGSSGSGILITSKVRRKPTVRRPFIASVEKASLSICLFFYFFIWFVILILLLFYF